MEPESRVLSAAEMTRWLILAVVLCLGIVAYFAFGEDAGPFHPVQSGVNIEGHR